jgi:hypothetical protein
MSTRRSLRGPCTAAEHVKKLAGHQVVADDVGRKGEFDSVDAAVPPGAEEPERAAALNRDFLEFATRANSGRPEGPAEYPYEYLGPRWPPALLPRHAAAFAAPSTATTPEPAMPTPGLGGG